MREQFKLNGSLPISPDTDHNRNFGRFGSSTCSLVVYITFSKALYDEILVSDPICVTI